MAIELHSAKLAIIIQYPTSASRNIVLIKNARKNDDSIFLAFFER